MALASGDFFVCHTNPSRFDTSNVTVCSRAGIIRFGCSFVSTFPIYRLRRNQANKEKEATLPFVEKVTSDSGGNDNNTQIYSRLRKNPPYFRAFPRCFFYVFPDILELNQKSNSICEQSVNGKRNIPYSNHQTPGQDDPADQAAYYKVHRNNTNRTA